MDGSFVACRDGVTVDVYEICTVVCPGLRFYSGRCTVTGPVIEVETLGG